MAESYRDVIAWQKGMDLAEVVYLLAGKYPSDSRCWGLVRQMCEAAASIPANIAEGYGRGFRKEYLQFLHFANGSLKELETYLLLSQRQKIGPPDEVSACLTLAEEEGRILTALIRGLRRKAD